MAPRIFTYRTYRWIDKDPIIDAIHTCISDERLNNHQVGQLSGVSDGTIKNWITGHTKRPNNSTISAVSSSLGYVRHDTLDKNGALQVRFVKAREYDYKDEIERAADWLLKHPRPKRKAKKKKNGHAK